MLLFTYGEVNTKPENVAIQKKHGIDAVICDNVGDVIASDPERKILKGKNLFTSNSQSFFKLHIMLLNKIYKILEVQKSQHPLAQVQNIQIPNLANNQGLP